VGSRYFVPYYSPRAIAPSWGVSGHYAVTTVITRRDSEDAVVMSLDYYNSLMETVHLLRSPANAEHLNRSIAQFKAAKTTQRELIDE